MTGDNAEGMIRQAEAALGYRLPTSPAFSFGDSPEMADRLCALVLDGIKTASCGWRPDPEIQAGTWSVLQDGQGRPRAVLELYEVRVLPFLEVDEAFAWEEGEGDRSLAWWRDAHRRFFSGFPEEGIWDDAQLVQCERFRVVWRAAGK